MEFGIFMPLGNHEVDKEIPKLTYNVKPELKMRQVWSEGYAATGERGYASYMGECLAESHIEACERLVPTLDRNQDGTVRLRNDGNPSVWACGLFDNEADARKSFG